MTRMTRMTVALSLGLAVTACDTGISLNPLNWFNSSASDEGLVALEPEGGWEQDTDRRLVVDQVTALRIQRTTAGAIVHATGLPPRLGYWDAELVAENDGAPENGVRTYLFKVATPRWATAASTPYARTIEAAAFIPNVELAGLRAIRVMGAQNSRTASR